MAPVKHNDKHFKGKHFTQGGPEHNAKKKRKWIPDNKFFDGSLKEGQGFALKRKEKIKQEYNKLLRKERWRKQQSSVQIQEEYPEHLKHLYLAEKKRLEEEEEEKKKKRCKGRVVNSEGEEEQFIAKGFSGKNESSRASDISIDQSHLCEEAAITSQAESSHKTPFTQSKQKKVSSYQKTKQEYERLKREREQKREEFLKEKAQREEALNKYKERKLARYQLLKRKTKKGQPNLNLQMEMLLEKIQAQQKN